MFILFKKEKREQRKGTKEGKKKGKPKIVRYTSVS